jgi:hypothetical protein
MFSYKKSHLKITVLLLKILVLYSNCSLPQDTEGSEPLVQTLGYKQDNQENRVGFPVKAEKLIFLKVSISALGSTHLSIHWYQGLFHSK